MTSIRDQLLRNGTIRQALTGGAKLP